MEGKDRMTLEQKLAQKEKELGLILAIEATSSQLRITYHGREPARLTATLPSGTWEGTHTTAEGDAPPVKRLEDNAFLISWAREGTLLFKLR